jgi:8-oxo-dGTP pyrophosphatase MutT (NUDIX family)
MTSTPFREVLQNLDLSERAEEQPFRETMLALLEHGETAFSRHSFPAHFTGSAFVVSADGSRALLHHHRKLGRWMQFGGHCEPGEDILKTASREAAEESGIASLILASPRPFDLDIHAIPARGAEPGHDHYDVRFVFIAPEGASGECSEESRELRWFTPDEMEALELDSGSRRLLAKWRRLLQKRGAHPPA